MSPVVAGFCFLFFACSITANAQKSPDTSGKLPIEIVGNTGTLFQSIQTDSGTINKLINNVSLRQGGTLMSCDSAYINTGKNNMQAFSNVVITQPGGTQVQSDYLRYTGNTKKAYLRGNVSLTDGGNNLWAEELEYDLGTKIGVYKQGGTLQSDATTLSSNAGIYNVKSKEARFTGEVFVTDPEYNVASADLGYNTETKLVHFYDSSLVTNDKSVLRTSSGTWDAKNEIAHFISRSSIQNEEQYIEADKMDYNRKTGWGFANGNVYALDTSRHTTIYCGYAQYNEISRQLLATIKPVMKQVNANDSIYFRADTFYAAPVAEAIDTITNGKTAIQKNIGKNIVEHADSIQNLKIQSVSDSARPRYFTGYHHVLIYSDSLQARCDSMSYSQADSIMRLMYHPIAWSRNSQITGDTILLYMDSSTLRKMYVPNNGFIISQSGPEKAQMFDQVQGKTITGFFENNAITQMIVWPNAEAIYYAKDESDAYLGMNQAQGERMKILFDSSEISKIILEQDAKQTMTPMLQVNIVASRLSRFQWQPDVRPKSIAELFLYDPFSKEKEIEEKGVVEKSTENAVKPKKKKRKNK